MNLQDIAKAMMELDDEMLKKTAIVSSGNGEFSPMVSVFLALEDRLKLNADVAGIDPQRPVLYANDATNRGLTLRGLREAFVCMESGHMKDPAIVGIGSAPYIAFHEVDALGMSDNQGEEAMRRFGSGQPIILYKSEPFNKEYAQIMEALDALAGKPSTDLIAKAMLYVMSKLNGSQLRDAVAFCKTV